MKISKHTYETIFLRLIFCVFNKSLFLYGHVTTIICLNFNLWIFLPISHIKIKNRSTYGTNLVTFIKAKAVLFHMYLLLALKKIYLKIIDIKIFGLFFIVSSKKGLYNIKSFNIFNMQITIIPPYLSSMTCYFLFNIKCHY